jgi:ABC-type nickel/cobalt efflux system permease component RcnA
MATPADSPFAVPVGAPFNDTITIVINSTEVVLQIFTEVQDITNAINGLWLFFCSSLVFCTLHPH